MPVIYIKIGVICVPKRFSLFYSLFSIDKIISLFALTFNNAENNNII